MTGPVVTGRALSVSLDVWSWGAIVRSASFGVIGSASPSIKQGERVDTVGHHGCCSEGRSSWSRMPPMEKATILARRFPHPSSPTSAMSTARSRGNGTGIIAYTGTSIRSSHDSLQQAKRCWSARDLSHRVLNRPFSKAAMSDAFHAGDLFQPPASKHKSQPGTPNSPLGSLQLACTTTGHS